MKKWIALCVAALLLLPMLSGCGKEATAPADTTAPVETTEAPTPIGTLYVSFGAALEIPYDAEGNSLALIGANEAGQVLADAKQDQLNKGCVYTLRSILRYAISEDLLGDTKTCTIRVGANDPLPSEDFLQVIGQDCQYLIDEEVAGVDLYCLSGNNLDEQGNLTYEMAQLLASKYLNAEVTPAEATPNSAFAFTADGKTCTVDAFTGLVVGQ